MIEVRVHEKVKGWGCGRALSLSKLPTRGQGELDAKRLHNQMAMLLTCEVRIPIAGTGVCRWWATPLSNAGLRIRRTCRLVKWRWDSPWFSPKQNPIWLGKMAASWSTGTAVCWFSSNAASALCKACKVCHHLHSRYPRGVMAKGYLLRQLGARDLACQYHRHLDRFPSIGTVGRRSVTRFVCWSRILNRGVVMPASDGSGRLPVALAHAAPSATSPTCSRSSAG